MSLQKIPSPASAPLPLSISQAIWDTNLRLYRSLMELHIKPTGSQRRDLVKANDGSNSTHDRFSVATTASDHITRKEEAVAAMEQTRQMVPTDINTNNINTPSRSYTLLKEVVPLLKSGERHRQPQLDLPKWQVNQPNPASRNRVQSTSKRDVHNLQSPTLTLAQQLGQTIPSKRKRSDSSFSSSCTVPAIPISSTTVVVTYQVNNRILSKHMPAHLPSVHIPHPNPPVNPILTSQTLRILRPSILTFHFSCGCENAGVCVHYAFLFDRSRLPDGLVCEVCFRLEGTEGEVVEKDRVTTKRVKVVRIEAKRRCPLHQTEGEIGERGVQCRPGSRPEDFLATTEQRMVYGKMFRWCWRAMWEVDGLHVQATHPTLAPPMQCRGIIEPQSGIVVADVIPMKQLPRAVISVNPATKSPAKVQIPSHSLLEEASSNSTAPMNQEQDYSGSAVQSRKLDETFSSQPSFPPFSRGEREEREDSAAAADFSWFDYHQNSLASLKMSNDNDPTLPQRSLSPFDFSQDVEGLIDGNAKDIDIHNRTDNPEWQSPDFLKGEEGEER